jgi:uncharacterized membrane protein YheB (UPF0754 family)
LEINYWLSLGMIPFTYGFVGWVTNWLALKMTFYPLHFWGIPPYLGWQGIIPRKAHKMAVKAVDVITEKLMNIEEVFSRVDPKQFEEKVYPLLKNAIIESTEKFGNSIHAELWASIPLVIKNEIHASVERSSRATMRNVILSLRSQIADYIDVKGIVLHCLTGKNVGLVVEVFQSVGKPEFKFIERSGFYFGFILGLFQLIFWILYPIDWTLPVQGIIVGYLTNYLAINMIFRPLQPVRFFGLFTYQGLFLKRQNEVSREYSKIVAKKILTPKNILEDILKGKASQEVTSMIEKSVMDQIDNLTFLAKPVIYSTGQNEKFNLLKKELSDQMVVSVLNCMDEIEPFLEEALDLEKTMGDRMSELSPLEFETVLRSAFQEDELLLILVGALLGALVGLGQMAFLL